MNTCSKIEHDVQAINLVQFQVVTFIDLAGHEKYLKTTIFGLTGHMPDYTMLMVGANAGIIGMISYLVQFQFY